MKTMFVKELRENAKWLVVGLLVMLALTWANLPQYLADYFINFKPNIGFAGGLFALFLGVMQSSWDFSDRQQGFLLHRSVSRNQILASKILAGMTIYAIVMGIPLLITACYLGLMGPDYLPVRPLQVVAPALLIALCYFIHPIAIFMMIRPAKWIGTKVLPLVIPIATCYFFCVAHDNRWQSWVIFVLLCLSLGILSMGMFCRAFERLSIVSNALTFIAIVTALIGAYSITDPINTTGDGAYVYEMQGVDKDGTVWNFLFRNKYDYATRDSKREILSGNQLVVGQTLKPDGKVPADLELTLLHLMPPVTTPPKNYGEIVRTGGLGEISIHWDERGYFLVYERLKKIKLLGTITREGFHPAMYL